MDTENLDMLAIGETAERAVRDAYNLATPVAPLWECMLEGTLRTQRAFAYGQAADCFAPNTVPGVQSMVLMDYEMQEAAAAYNIPAVSHDMAEAEKVVLAMVPEDKEGEEEKPRPGMTAPVTAVPPDFNKMKDTEQRHAMANLLGEGRAAAMFLMGQPTSDGAVFWSYVAARMEALSNTLREPPEEGEGGGGGGGEGEGEDEAKGGGEEKDGEEQKEGPGGGDHGKDNPDEEDAGHKFGKREEFGSGNPTGKDAGSSGKTGDGGGLFRPGQRIKV